MPPRQVLLLRILLGTLGVFFALALWRPEWSSPNVLALVGFSVMLVLIGHLTLGIRDGQAVDGLRGLPRSFWVVFASLTGAFGFAMLVAIVAMPWVGYRGFALLLGKWSWWVLPLIAVGLYPMVKTHLR